MSENIQMICAIDNRTRHTLKLQKTHLEWGKFYDSPNKPPDEVINPKQKASPAFRSSGKQGTASGTEGYVIYQFNDNSNEWIKIYWDVPWAPGASNKVSVETFDQDVVASLDGFTGSGAVESISIRIVDGRG